jgi:hypothetical protein
MRHLTPHWEMKQPSYEFGEWFGMKYDLIPRLDLEWEAPALTLEDRVSMKFQIMRIWVKSFIFG